MDTNLQLRFELNNLVDQWVDNVIHENGISYAMMEDALNATLVRIKGEVFKEYMSAVQQAAMMASQAQAQMGSQASVEAPAFVAGPSTEEVEASVE